MKSIEPIYENLISPLYEKVGDDWNFETRFAECGALAVSDSEIATENPRPLQEGHATLFDGIDDYGAAPVVGLSTTQEFTISAWVYKPDNNTNGFNVVWASGLTGQTRLRFTSASNRLYLASVDTGVDVPLAAWTHVAVDYTDYTVASTMRINGVVEWVGAVNFATGNDIYIAAQSDGVSVVSGRFKGGVADLKISSAINPLVERHFKLDEITGSIMFDSSTNKAHGTYHGSPTNDTDVNLPYSYPNQEGFNRAYLLSQTGSGWGSNSAWASKKLSGDFEVEYHISHPQHTMLGLSTDPTQNDHYNTSEFAVYAQVGVTQVYELGIQKHAFGDIGFKNIKISRIGDTIIYLVNDTYSYTSTLNTYDDLYVRNVGSEYVGGVVAIANGEYVEWDNFTEGYSEAINTPRQDGTELDIYDTPLKWIDSGYPTKYVKRNSNALSFDGIDDYISTKIDITNESKLNISLWIKPNEPTINVRFLSIKHSNNDDIRLYNNAGMLNFSMDDGTSDLVGSNISSTLNEWVYVECGFEGGFTYLTVDGVRNEVASSFDFAGTSGEVSFMSDDSIITNSSNKAAGEMAIVKINNILHLPLAEGQDSNKVYDISGNKNHGVKFGNITNTPQDVNHFNIENGFSLIPNECTLGSFGGGDLSFKTVVHGGSYWAGPYVGGGGGIFTIVTHISNTNSAFGTSVDSVTVDGVNYTSIARNELFALLHDGEVHDITIHGINSTIYQNGFGVGRYASGGYYHPDNKNWDFEYNGVPEPIEELISNSTGMIPSLLGSNVECLGLTPLTSPPITDGLNKNVETELDFLYVGENDTMPLEVGKVVPQPPSDWSYGDSIDPTLHARTVGEYKVNLLRYSNGLTTPPWTGAVQSSLFVEKEGDWWKVGKANTTRSAQFRQADPVSKVGNYIIRASLKAGNNSSIQFGLYSGGWNAIAGRVISGSGSISGFGSLVRIDDLDSSETIVEVEYEVVDIGTGIDGNFLVYPATAGSTTAGEYNYVRNFQIWEGTLDQDSPDYVETTDSIITKDERTGYDRFVLMSSFSHTQECLDNISKYTEENL